MVHKRSEYELQFRKLTNDLREQIWRENFLFRETQKRINRSHHYWRHQLIDESCECDEEENINRSANRTINVVKEAHPIVLEDNGVHSEDQEDVTKTNLISSEELSPDTADSLTAAATVSKNTLQNHMVDAPLVSNNKHTVTEDQYKNFINKPELKNVEVLPSSPFHSHLNPSPTRNNIKFYQCGQRMTPVFAAYGWNDMQKDVGDQKTYNVRAPLDQVHPSALLASSNRLKELELHFAEQLRKKRQQRPLLSLGPVNLSSIWMTEYQESYSKGHRESLVQTVYKRPIVWRYT